MRLQSAHGPDDALVGCIEGLIGCCHKGLRDSVGSTRLHSEMNRMLRQAQGARSIERTVIALFARMIDARRGDRRPSMES